MAPKVSVLITAYNREDLVGDAIESALRSTFQDLEVIVADDCSTDRTFDVAKEIASKESRVRAVRNEQNIGDNPNRNRAAALATGEFLKYLDSDDILYPHGLAVFVNAMDRFPEAAIGLSHTPDDALPFPIQLDSAQAYRRHFFDHDVFGRAPGSTIIRRSAFDAVGGFRNFEGRGPLGDLELWLRLARQYPIVLLPRDLVWDRQHGNQESTFQRRSPYERLRIDRKLQLEALNASDCPLSTAERKLASRRLQQTDAIAILRTAIWSRRPRDAFKHYRASNMRFEEFLGGIRNPPRTRG